MKINRIILILAAVFLSGCATKSTNLTPQYVSPLAYKDYDCDQILAEQSRIQRRASELSGHIDKRASGDQVQAAVAAVLFWPALFALGNNDEQNAEFTRLKGESIALEQAAIDKKCAVSSQAEPEKEGESKI